jgi:hypothetical protein
MAGEVAVRAHHPGSAVVGGAPAALPGALLTMDRPSQCRLRRHGPLAAVALGAATWLTAAAAVAATLPDPRLEYRSSFTGPAPADPPARRWNESNELVRQLGGHAGHLRGSTPVPQGSEQAAPRARTADAMPATPPGQPPGQAHSHRHPHGGTR